MSEPALHLTDAPCARSASSLDFETRWRAMPKRGPIPVRSEFSPRAFAPLLKHIVLLDFSTGRSPWSRIRVVGEGIRERVQSDITSHDYLDFLSTRYHADAMESVDLMVNHPCGLWQVMAAHYQRGFSQYLELTAFPFATESGPAQLLALLAPTEGRVVPMPPGLSVMSIDSAISYTFLDVGCGVPDWHGTHARK